MGIPPNAPPVAQIEADAPTHSGWTREPGTTNSEPRQVVSPAAATTRDSSNSLIKQLLVSAARHGASDLHVHVGHPLMLRINGKLKSGKPPAYRAEDTEKLLLEILNPIQKESFFRDKDICFSFECDENIRARAAYCYQRRGGIDGVFRIIKRDIPSMESLGLPDGIKRFTTYSQGLLLFSGPSGCGKSTTMASVIDEINKTRRQHIITIEQPIEFVHTSKNCLVHQREVGAHTASFKAALRSALREDPDIIVVGELVDRETIGLAISASETGHLVLGTLHTNNAVRTINRILDVFPPQQLPQVRSMVASSLRGVVSQRLIPSAKGDTRLPAVEILSINSAVSGLIREGKTFQIPAAMQLGRSSGMRLLDESLVDLVQQGKIARAEAVKHAEKTDLFPVDAAKEEES